jgi:hypothetical protein
MDGYTEQTHFLRIPELTTMVEQEYELIGEVSGNRHPVQVFRRIDSKEPEL